MEQKPLTGGKSPPLIHISTFTYLITPILSDGFRDQMQSYTLKTLVRTCTRKNSRKLTQYLTVTTRFPIRYLMKTCNVLENGYKCIIEIILIQEHRSYEFLPELSSGKQYDKIVFPNIVMISAIASYADSGFLEKIALSTAFRSTDSGIFKVICATI